MAVEKSNGADKEETRSAKKTPRKKGQAPHSGRAENDPPTKRRALQGKKDELFDYQPTSTDQLPPAKEFVESFVPKVLEGIHGLREIRQMTKWMNHSVYQAVEARAASIRRRNNATKNSAPRPKFALGNVVISEPRDGVCEAAAVIHGPTRVRAVALRMEGLDHEWKATSFRML